MDSNRPFDLRDIPEACSALLKAWGEGKKTKEWLNQYELGEEQIVINDLMFSPDSFSHIVNETYLVSYRIEEPHASASRKILRENIVLRIYPGPGKFSDVVEHLKSEALKWECTGIMVATALGKSNERLIKIYQDHGFQVEAVELFLPVG